MIAVFVTPLSQTVVQSALAPAPRSPLVEGIPDRIDVEILWSGH